MKNKPISAIPNADHGHTMVKSPGIVASAACREARTWAFMALLRSCPLRSALAAAVIITFDNMTLRGLDSFTRA
jgi:hypothetical protein